MKAIATTAVVALLTSVLLFGADTKGTTGKSMHLPLKGTVVAVTPLVLTLKGGPGKEDRKFKITKDTKILRGEATASIEDVRANLIVTGSYIKNDAGNTLTKLQIAPKPSTPKKKGAAKTVNSGKGDGKGGGGTSAKSGQGTTKGNGEVKKSTG